MFYSKEKGVDLAFMMLTYIPVGNYLFATKRKHKIKSDLLHIVR